ncbi:hypothetical protein ALC62_05884 [Cyphomyrmex costatus]|uniref:Uncharacterized protein n=1 Tax=Cyphomyrmex costatus TaxID=456900 RepID=A0A195CR89_9HYME|nr:hypothetical protein ALC62_05884 [Cyphomyrmex costatus]
MTTREFIRKVLSVTLSTLRGSREKRSSCASRRLLRASVCFSCRKKERTAKKTAERERGGEGERERERGRLRRRIPPRYALYNGRSFFTLNLIKLHRSTAAPAGYCPL